MACWDERLGEQLRLPRLLAIAPSDLVRERLGPLASTRFRERGVSGVGRLVRSQDLESAGSRKVVKCAVFALLPPSDFLPPRPQRNSEGVAIPFFTPILVRHRCQLNKVSPKVATAGHPYASDRCITKLIELRTERFGRIAAMLSVHGKRKLTSGNRFLCGG